jgi:hypothetical protein
VPIVDGRQVLPTVLLPTWVVGELERRAREAGVDPADRQGAFACFLGDLVADELPEAIAEAAADLLRRGAEAERDRKIEKGPERPLRALPGVSTNALDKRSVPDTGLVDMTPAVGHDRA